MQMSTTHSSFNQYCISHKTISHRAAAAPGPRRSLWVLHDIISVFVPPRNKCWRRHCPAAKSWLHQSIAIKNGRVQQRRNVIRITHDRQWWKEFFTCLRPSDVRINDDDYDDGDVLLTYVYLLIPLVDHTLKQTLIIVCHVHLVWDTWLIL